jgi:hypothetical protein
MAETSYQTSPKLTHTADAQPYAPISLFAVAAAVSALIFAIIFILLALSSILKKQPLIMQELLFLPALTLVLAFAAFCHIRNAEGTRTGRLFGVNLVAMSAGIALLVGAGYAAYLGAIEFAVRKDAENVFLEWTSNLKELDAADPNDTGIVRTVHRTLEPSAQQRIAATDVAGIRTAFGEQYMQLSQCDMVRICRRNPGKVEFKPLGLVEWVRKQQRVTCSLNADLISPEGVHTISLRMIAVIAPNGQRLWGLENKPAYVTRRRLTPYGKKVEELEIVGGLIAQRFIEPMGPQTHTRITNPEDLDAFHRRIYVDFMHNPYPPAKDPPLVGVAMRTAIGSGIASYEPLAIGYEQKLFNGIFQPAVNTAGLSPDDKLKRETDAREKFKAVWNGNRFMRPGSMLRSSKDVFPVLSLDDTGARCSVPVEFVLPGSETAANTARGRVILETTDPATLDELKTLRASADPRTAVEAGFPEVPKTIIPWRVVRIVSDMNPAPVSAQQQQPQAAPEVPG